MFRIIAALFLLLASAAASSAQNLFPSVWQSQRGVLLKVLAVDPYDLVGRVRGPPPPSPIAGGTERCA
jgi:hypothetical protein